MTQRTNRLAAELLHRLKNLRGSFGDNAAGLKTSLLKRLSRTMFLKPSELLAYHDLLCFLRAFPDNTLVASLAEQELRSFGRRVDKYKQLSRDRRGRKLANSGLAHTVTTHPFSYEMTRRLYHAIRELSRLTATPITTRS